MYILEENILISLGTRMDFSIYLRPHLFGLPRLLGFRKISLTPYNQEPQFIRHCWLR